MIVSEHGSEFDCLRALLAAREGDPDRWFDYQYRYDGGRWLVVRNEPGGEASL